MKEYAELIIDEEKLFIILFQYNNKTRLYHELLYSIEGEDDWIKGDKNYPWSLTYEQFAKGEHIEYMVDNTTSIPSRKYANINIIEANFYDYDEFMEKYFEAFL